MKEVLKLVLWLVSAILLMSCENQHDDGARRFCDNEQRLLVQTNAVDTAVWDLNLSMESFLLDVLDQTGIDSCEGLQVIYLKVNLPEFGLVYIPGWLGNPYCACCPDLPAVKLRRINIDMSSDSILFNGDVLDQKFLYKQLMYQTNFLFIQGKHKQALYNLNWNDLVTEEFKKSVLQTILNSYFNSLEQEYAGDEADFCSLQSVSEMPRFILMIEKDAVPPPPPPPAFLDSLVE